MCRRPWRYENTLHKILGWIRNHDLWRMDHPCLRLDVQKFLFYASGMKLRILTPFSFVAILTLILFVSDSNSIPCHCGYWLHSFSFRIFLGNYKASTWMWRIAWCRCTTQKWKWKWTLKTTSNFWLYRGSSISHWRSIIAIGTLSTRQDSTNSDINRR